MADVVILINAGERKWHYAARQLFQRILGWDVVITERAEEARSTELPVITYGTEPIEGSYAVEPMPEEVALADPFADPVRFTWIMLTSYSTGEAKDEHARVRTPTLLASRKGWLDRPILDEVAIAFASQLASRFSVLPPIRRKYTHFATLDVDNGFKYLGRPLWRTLGSAGRDLLHGRMGELIDRMSTHLGTGHDPYDIYGDFHRMTEGNADRVIANFLVAQRGEFDHAVGLSSRLMVERMLSMATWADVGVHPSYRSSERPELIASERDALAAVIGRPVTSSRQHFLRFNDPETFLEQERIGIKEDHSVGLHDAIGFRAGTCTPFPFYDVRNDRETDLMIFPFQVMDSAMAYKMKLTPDDAIAAAKRIIDQVKAVQGTFIGVWHERFISDHGAEKGWRHMVEETIRYARP